MKHCRTFAAPLVAATIVACSSQAAPAPTPTPLPAPGAPEPTIIPTLPAATAMPATMASITAGDSAGRAGEPTCPEPTEGISEINNIEFGTAVVEGFEDQILNYLSTHGSADGLQDALSNLEIAEGQSLWAAKSQVMTLDVTGDQIPEVTLHLVFYVEAQYADGVIFVMGCSDGRYRSMAAFPIAAQVFTGEDPDPGLRALRDMDGDGVPEIIYSYIEIIGTHANFTRVFKILSWDGKQFIDVIQSDSYDPLAVRVNNGDGEIIDSDADGIFELVIMSGLERGGEVNVFDRLRTDVWQWTGEAVERTCSKSETVPSFRIQAILDGDNATRCGAYDEALAFYQQGVFDEQLFGWSKGRSPYAAPFVATPATDPDERSRLNAYGRYRILLLHAARGLLPEATTVYDGLMERFPSGTMGSQYAELATIFWEAFTAAEDIETACRSAQEFAAANPEEITGPLGSDFYGIGQPDYSQADICPFG